MSEYLVGGFHAGVRSHGADSWLSQPDWTLPRQKRPKYHQMFGRNRTRTSPHRRGIHFPERLTLPHAPVSRLSHSSSIGNGDRCSILKNTDGRSVSPRMKNSRTGLKPLPSKRRKTSNSRPSTIVPFINLPHKDSEKANVVNPLAKTFIAYSQDRTMTSPVSTAKNALDSNTQRNR